MEHPSLLKRNRSLVHFLTSRFLFILAMQMVNTAVGWYLYELTGNPLSLGWLGLSEVIPAIGLALYAGHVIDISNKRNVLFTGMRLYLLATIALLTITILAGNDGSRSWLEIGIYFVIFCTGIFRAFTGPTFSAILAQLVEKTELAKAVTYSSTAWQSAAVIGPVLAGVFISLIGITYMFVITIVLLAIACFFAWKLPNLPVMHTTSQKTWHSVKAGLGYVWRTKEVLTALSVDMFAVLFGGAVAMLPVFAKDILHVNATGMGLLKAAQGIGSVIILFLMSRRPLQKNQGRLMLQSVAGFGLCMIVFAISKNYWLSFGVLLLSGILDGLSVVVRSTILQLYVPDDMRGRVSSVNSMFINSSNELGQFESGVAARLMGTVPSVVFGGCMTLLVVAIAWWKAPTLRKLEY